MDICSHNPVDHDSRAPVRLDFLPMGDAETVSERERSRRRALAKQVREAPLKRKLGLAAVIALIASGLFGGLDDPWPEPTTLELGKTYDVGPLTVTVDRVLVMDRLEGVVSPSSPDDRLLVIVGTVGNEGDTPAFSQQLGETLYSPDAGVRLPGGEQPIAQVFQVADSTPIREINPGTSYEVVIVFDQEGDWDQPTIDLGINQWRWIQDDGTIRGDSWLASHPMAEATVPVRQRASEEEPS